MCEQFWINNRGERMPHCSCIMLCGFFLCRKGFVRTLSLSNLRQQLQLSVERGLLLQQAEHLFVSYRFSHQFSHRCFSLHQNHKLVYVSVHHDWFLGRDFKYLKILEIFARLSKKVMIKIPSLHTPAKNINKTVLTCFVCLFPFLQFAMVIHSFHFQCKS